MQCDTSQNQKAVIPKFCLVDDTGEMTGMQMIGVTNPPSRTQRNVNDTDKLLALAQVKVPGQVPGDQ